VGTVVWQYRGQIHLTVAIKATFAIPRAGDLQLPVRSQIAPVEWEAHHNEVVPLLSRAEVHLAVRREGTYHLAVYRGQDRLMNKSGNPAAFAPMASTHPRRRASIASIKWGVMVRVPNDFEWGALQAAPEDQQLDRLHGTEWVIVGASGDSEATRVHLPGMAASVKAYGIKDLNIPVPRLDMVSVDLNMMRCALVWRTNVEVSEAAALLNVTAIAAAVHQAAAPFDFPTTLDVSKIAKSCELPAGYRPPNEIMVPDVELTTKPSALNMTMGAAPAASGPALPFGAQAAKAADDADRTVEVPPDSIQVGVKPDALNMTMGADAAVSGRALPFAVGAAAAPSEPHAVVGSAGAPWEQPARPVPHVPPAPNPADDPSTAVHNFDEVMAHATASQPESVTLDADPPAKAQPIPGAPWAARESAPGPPSPPSSVRPPMVQPVQAAPPPPISQPQAAPPPRAYTAPGVAPPPVVPSAPVVAKPEFLSGHAAALAELEKRRAEREVERARVQREFQLEEKKHREQLEALAADEVAARATEDKRAQEDERAETKRKREDAERTEAERARERQSAQDAKQRQAKKLQDTLYGFKTK
jgi:hypothetical protein